MARIAGVNIPTNKRVVIALQYIHGIGPKKAEEICEKVQIPAERRVAQLTDAEWQARCDLAALYRALAAELMRLPLGHAEATTARLHALLDTPPAQG